MIREFKEFAVQGNMVDMAVGFVVGAAFGKIVTSLVSDVIMPPFGAVLGKADFSKLYINLSGTEYPSLTAAQEAGAPTINYGLFLNTMIEFLIVAFAIFMVVRLMNRMRKPAPVAAATTKECPKCCTEIPLAAVRCPNCTSELSAA